MERSVGETENGDTFLDLKKLPASKSPHRYTKEELLDIKERPHSKQRPSCLSEKYDSDGVWDPEKWHASLYPASGRSSPVENLKKELDNDRPSLVRRIIGIVECNGGVTEEDEVEVILTQEPTADQEVPRDAVLPEQSPGEFDFNEFFNLDKVPCLASMIEDVLGEGSVSASRFSRWFSNPSRSGSRSSSLGSTPHEELERLAGLEQAILSPGQNSGNYFAPIPLEDHAENKVDILEMLQKAKVDLKPLLSSLSANKEKLKESSHSGVVLSVEEVEAGLKGLKVDQQVKNSTPFMAEHLEETLNAVTSNRQLKKDGDMTAFNKLVSTMKRNLESHLMSPAEIPGQPVPKNILQELLGQPVQRPASSNLLSGLMGSLEPSASLLGQRASSPPMSQVFQTRAASADYLRPRIPSPIGFTPGPQQLLGDPFQGMRKPMSPVTAQMSQLELQQAALEGLALPHDLAVQAASFYQPGFGKPQVDRTRDGFRNRQQRVTKSPAPVHQGNSSSPAPAASITSMLSPSFTPTSVIRKMYESKEKSKEELASGKAVPIDSKEDTQKATEGMLLGSNPFLQDYSYSASESLDTEVSNTICEMSEAYRCKSLSKVYRKCARGLGMWLKHTLSSFSPTGVLPPGIDLTHLQGISGPILGQPFYPLPAANHPLLNPRPGTPLHLAMMQQQLQRSVLHPPGSGSQAAAVSVQTTPQNVPSRSGLPQMHSQLEHRPSQRSSSPVGLAKWFGSDVLQQPLPSMPAKVISVDELEYRQ
uniref:Eukaryotic translation initiation factor 4E nuclear import factor 1 n=1 Tax=Urocitellus parryii TaxID=9999 RepID=A0A8D2ICZ5_UROPR